mgnify:CR=1 FL=1
MVAKAKAEGKHIEMVLENGKITEQGTHKELLEKQGYYYKIYRIQQGLAGEEEIAAALEGGAF